MNSVTKRGWQVSRELVAIQSTLESGSYTFWTEESVTKGRAYIEENFVNNDN